MSIILSVLLVWLLLIPLAILNGTIRQYVYLKKVGELRAHQISSIAFTSVIFIVTAIYLSILGSSDTKELIFIGVFWTLLTVLFEFVFGHYVMKHSWQKLFADYNLKQGRIWGLVLLASLLAPITIDWLL